MRLEEAAALALDRPRGGVALLDTWILQGCNQGLNGSGVFDLPQRRSRTPADLPIRIPQGGDQGLDSGCADRCQRLGRERRVPESSDQGFDSSGVFDVSQRLDRAISEAVIKFLQGGDQWLNSSGVFNLPQRPGRAPVFMLLQEGDQGQDGASVFDLSQRQGRVRFGLLITSAQRGDQGLKSSGLFDLPRSEERRVGKECRSRWAPYPEKK